MLKIHKDVVFSNGSPLVLDGRFVIGEKNESLKTWCLKSLLTPRFKHLIYSYNYGSELDALVGENYSKAFVLAECERLIQECLLVNPYIKGISNVNCEFLGSLLSVEFNLITIYGNEKMTFESGF